jgi:hypothetical protein
MRIGGVQQWLMEGRKQTRIPTMKCIREQMGCPTHGKVAVGNIRTSTVSTYMVV